MTGYTRRQLIDAWEAIDRIDAYNRDLAAIKAVLPERPKQTMDELGWDNEYILAEADTFDGDGEKVVMLYVGNFYGTEIGTNAGIFDPKDLTPTGRRYTLTEVQDD